MQYLTQTELFVKRTAACRKQLLCMSLTLCFALNASHSSGIKLVTGTCHLQFGPLQGGTLVWVAVISSLCSQSEILPGGSQRRTQTESNSSVSCRGVRLWFVFNSVQMLVWECAGWGLPLKFSLCVWEVCVCVCVCACVRVFARKALLC